MLFVKPKILLYLKRQTLEVYLPKTEGTQARLEFPPNYQKDEEIIDQLNFEQLISDFLSKLNIKDQKIIIALSPEILFEKVIPLANPKTESEQAKKFFDEIPFDLPKIVKKEIRTKNGLTLIATNRNLFEAIIHVIQKLALEIEAVVPVTVFGITQTATLTKQDLKKILSNSNMLKNCDFLETGKSGTGKNQVKEETAPKRNYLFIVGIALIIIGFVIIAVLFYKPSLFTKFQLKLSKPSPPAKLTESPAAEMAASPEAISEETTKEEIKIQVLNGSGVAGQASNVKNALENLGYLEIEIGNAQTQDFADTIISISESVSPETKDELKTELEKTFKSIKVEVQGKLQDFDIVITTGKLI